MLVTLPYFVPVGKKEKNFYVNLNIYRNAHHFTLNSAKVTFKETIQDQLDLLPFLNKIKLHYRVFAPSKRKIDTMNVGSIADKFFCDALVEAGKLTDDNYDYILYNGFEFGGIDKENPRVEVTIEETAPMKIIFGAEEIQQALHQYVSRIMAVNVAIPEIQLEALADGSFHAMLEMPMPTPSTKPMVSRMLEPKVDQSAISGSTRAAVSEALEQAKDEEPKAEAKPTLLTKPVARSGSIMPPKKREEAKAEPEAETVTQDAEAVSEEPAPVTQNEDEAKANISTGEERVNPTEEVSQTEATAPTTEATVDAPAEQEQTVQTGIGGKVEEPAPKPATSIFNFKKSPNA